MLLLIVRLISTCSYYITPTLSEAVEVEGFLVLVLLLKELGVSSHCILEVGLTIG